MAKIVLHGAWKDRHDVVHILDWNRGMPPYGYYVRCMNIRIAYDVLPVDAAPTCLYCLGSDELV